MEVKINISKSEQHVKELKEAHTSDLPSLISAISRIKESTNSFLTDVINNTAENGSGGGSATVVEDENEGDDAEDDEDEEENVKEVETKTPCEPSKRKSTNQNERKRLKT